MSNPESNKHDVDKRMWSTNYRGGDNPAIRQKWIDNKYLEPTVAPNAKTVISSDAKTTIQIAALIIFAWTVLGLVAFVWSLYCFKKAGTTEQKVLGLLLALFIGPLFFIYYKYSPSYCK